MSDPIARVTITGTYRLVLEHYPDDVSTAAEAAAFDELQMAEESMAPEELIQWMQEHNDCVVTIEAVEP